MLGVCPLITEGMQVEVCNAPDFKKKKSCQIAGVFADLVDVLEPLGVQLPSQLLTSPYLTLQREQRKRKQEARGSSSKRKAAKDLYNRWETR